MKYYELIYLVSPGISKEELNSLQEKINFIVQAEAGILGDSRSEGKRELVYQIQKKNEAFLASVNFYLKPEKLENLEKEIKSEEKILRYSIFAKKPVKKTKIFKRKRRIKKEKVELEEIEKKLKEILDES